MNKIIIKKILIYLLTLFIAIQGIYLFVFPLALNNFINSPEFVSKVKDTLGLDLAYDEIKIKTYPDFSLRLNSKNLVLKNEKKMLFNSKKLVLSVFLPNLILDRLYLKKLDVEDCNIVISLKDDNKFYFGDNFIDIDFLLKKIKKIDVKSLKIANSTLFFDDFSLNKKYLVKIPHVDFSYKNKKYFSLDTKSELLINDKVKTQIDFNCNSRFLSKSYFNEKIKIEGFVKNLDLSDFSVYFARFLNKDIKTVSELIDVNLTTDKSHNLDIKLVDYSIKFKNPLDNVLSKNPIIINSDFSFKNKKLLLDNLQIKSNDFDINAKGLINNPDLDLKNNATWDLDIDVNHSSINDLYWLIPTTSIDVQNVIQKLKKYGVWGYVESKLKLKGRCNSPQIFGNMLISDLYIVKNNPNVPHSNVDVQFLKDKVSVKTRVWAGAKEYVDVSGIAEIKQYGKGDFHIVSSENVDFETAMYMLIPVHEVVGFDLGPVPYMDLKGKGNINLVTKGTIFDGVANGVFNFVDTTAQIDGLNAVIENVNGSLVFDGRKMIFSTDKALLNNRNLKILGKADFDGNLDFDVTSENINIDNLLHVLNTSQLLETKKTMISPIDYVVGPTSLKINIKGLVKDFSKLSVDKDLKVSGSLNLKSVKAKIKTYPFVVENLQGDLSFDNDGWQSKLQGILCGAKFFLNGSSRINKTDLSVSSKNINIDALRKKLSENAEYSSLKNLPKINALLNFEASYKSKSILNIDNIDLNNFIASGYLKSANKFDNSAFNVNKGQFKINNGNITISDFDANFLNSKIYINLLINNFFENYSIFNGNVNITDFNISALDSIKNMHFVPDWVQEFLNAYEGYKGNADLFLRLKNNAMHGYLNLKNISFVHGYFKTLVTVDNAKIVFDGSKILLKSVIAQVDNIPVFLNFTIFDLDKNMKVKGYLTTKITETFVNKHINSLLTYPIKPKGDITFTADIDGVINSLRIKPRIKFLQGADIYYMGANLGDEDDEREIIADFVANGNSYIFKKLNYIRYIKSQNDKANPLVIITGNGVIKQVFDKVTNARRYHIQSFNIETENNANAKIFNILFKKSVLKSGMFDCKLNIKGGMENPTIKGVVNMSNVDMPLYNTNLKNVSLLFNDKLLYANAHGSLYTSDFKLSAVAHNNFKPPYIFENLDINSDKLNLDMFIDSLTMISTPDTTTKMTGVSSSKVVLPVQISDIQIKKGKMFVKDIVIRDLPANNYTCDFSLGKDLVLNIDKIWFDVTTGKMTGTASYNFADSKIKANLAALNIDSNQVASSLLGFKDQIFGQANANIAFSTKGNNEEDRIRNMLGYVYFEIADGKMPKLGSVEYLLKAGNLVKSGIMGASISNFIDLIVPIKTGYFNSIKGNFALKNGIAQNIEVYSKGDNLNLYINGDFDILQQYSNLRVFGRLTRKATNMLGAVGNMSFNTLLNSIPGFKLGKNDKSLIQNDLNKIPDVELSDQSYRVFTVKIDGHLNDDKYVKNFRWIE